MEITQLVRAVGHRQVLLLDEACGGLIWRVVEDAFRVGHDVDLQAAVVAGTAYTEITVHQCEIVVEEHLHCIGPLGALPELTRTAVMMISSTLSSVLARRTVEKARRVLQTL